MRADICANFMQLLSNQIYTLLMSFIETCLNIIELCCFIKDNPHFSAFKRHILILMLCCICVVVFFKFNVT